MAGSPLDNVLEAARVALERRRNDLLDTAAKIRVAVDAYVEAVEVSLAAEVASKLGIEHPAAASPVNAARTLHDLVLNLPEVRLAPVGQTPAETPVMKDLVRDEPISSPRRSTLDVYEAGPAARALWAELRNLDFEGMSVPLFKATASELAARARVLQECGENAELIPERVIKKLTAHAAERSIKGIFGLARHHEGDWVEIARKAAEERERVRNGANGLTQRLPISAPTSVKAPESTPKPKKVPDAETSDPIEIEDLPKLQALAGSSSIVLVGGLVENKKVDWIARHYGFRPEWVETKNNVKAVQSLEGRILDGRVGAVMLLDGLLGHVHSEPIVAAARQTGTPLVYGDTAGTASLRKGFEEIEQRLDRLAFPDGRTASRG